MPDKPSKLSLSARNGADVKLVMTLLARNEADILDAHLAFHLEAGVDFVVAIDNGSSDGTTEILETYARDGHVDVTRDERDYKQGQWVTRMARRAASEFGADWVINSDTDEFWWPRGGSLKDVFAAVPRRYGVVRGMWRHFAPRPFGDEFFAERMTVRVTNPGVDDNSPYSARFKSAHRADPAVEVLEGNHRAVGAQLRPIPGWYPIDVLHFPIRSFERFKEKYLRQWALLGVRFGGTVHEAHARGDLHAFYERYVIGDGALAAGLAGGTLAIDTRLRDAFRELHAGCPLDFGNVPVDEGYLSELAMLTAGDLHTHVQRRAEELELRLAELERRPSSRLASAISRRLRRVAAS
jgi:glycosyl transferase family 2